MLFVSPFNEDETDAGLYDGNFMRLAFHCPEVRSNGSVWEDFIHQSQEMHSWIKLFHLQMGFSILMLRASSTHLSAFSPLQHDLIIWINRCSGTIVPEGDMDWIIEAIHIAKATSKE